MSEPNLGPLFNASVPKPQLDAEAVIEASRRRRRPRFIALGVAAVLVAAGAIGGVGALVIHPVGGANAAASAGPHPSGAVPASGATIHSVGPHVGGLCQTKSAIPGDNVLCGCGAVSLPPITNDISAQLSFPAEREGHDSDGVVTITNTGQMDIAGTAATPVSFIVAEGVIVSPIGANDSAGHAVDLAPGASEAITVAFPGLNCAAGDAPAGNYAVGAFIDLMLSNGQHVGIVASDAKVAVSQ